VTTVEDFSATSIDGEEVSLATYQFGNQEHGSDEEIKQLCTLPYGVSFPMFAKIDVNGRDAHPLSRWLRTQKSGAPGEVIKWNFTKFLVGRDGRVTRRYGPATKPAKLVPDIETALNSKRPLPASNG